MKKLILILLVLLSFNAFSQNWQPVNAASSYFFKAASSDFIDKTIHVDSTTYDGGHPVYHLNTGLSLCDTCDPMQFNCIDGWLIYNIAAGFLQRRVHEFNNETYWFEGPGSFVLLPGALPGESWIFDTLNNIQAVVIAANPEEIFPGVTDSVKQIHLSDGNEILLTKNFGILQFPGYSSATGEYALCGMQTGEERYGETPPAFWDYFDFEVGDVFQYSGVTGGVTLPPPGWNMYTLKIRVTSMEQTEDSLIVGQHVIKRWFIGGGVQVDDVERVYVDDLQNPLNYLPGTKYDICNMYPVFCEWSVTERYTLMRLDKFELDGNLYSLSNFDSIQYEGNMYHQCPSDPEFFGLSQYGTMGFTYTEGLGQTAYNETGFEYYNHYNIEGYVKSGDTTGTVTPDEILLDVNEKLVDQQPVIIPNPSNGVFRIDLDRMFNLLIIDLTGKIVYHGKHNSLDNIEVGFLKPGMYIAQINRDQQIINRKLIIR